MRYEQRDEAHIGRNMGEERCKVDRQKGPDPHLRDGWQPGFVVRLWVG